MSPTSLRFGPRNGNATKMWSTVLHRLRFPCVTAYLSRLRAISSVIQCAGKWKWRIVSNDEMMKRKCDGETIVSPDSDTPYRISNVSGAARRLHSGVAGRRPKEDETWTVRRRFSWCD